ncbi:MAG: polyprenyl synthetase family protein [Dysgonamonadaceae bacterium]|jgi:geranylgeranyl diphosphate synthase type II|nr:polyprenyl synthetase family protein [Dysgonamonadaceae bacterium]
MITFQETLDKINREIDKISYHRPPVELYDPIRYILSLGGKRIRPALVLLACNLYEDDTDKAIPTALGWEIFHNFTLMHDDLMDRANVRRGKTTVHKKWNDNTAILSGDAMFILSCRYIAQSPDNCLKNILELFGNTAAEICEGQQYDMNFESRMDVSEAEYLEMIRLKTAVMLGACLKSGAIVAGAPSEDADRLYDFGINIGLAFQLKDDLLDVFGNPEVFGKNIGGDILCNKKTFLLINALNKVEGESKRVLLHWLSVSDPVLNEQKVRAVTGIYNELKLKELSEQKMQYFFDEAVMSLKKLSVPDAKTEVLHQLSLSLMQRNI